MHLDQEFRKDLRKRAGRARRYVNRRRNGVLRAWHAEQDQDHLVPEPVFVLCSPRSGSTLLRSVLDTHTQICAPHELHLGTMQVSTARNYAVNSWDALGLSLGDLENMLWDRALHRVLLMSGKRIIVDKTPQNAMIWSRIHEFWPRARFIHLHRHPASIVESLVSARPHVSREYHTETVVNYGRALDAARAALPGPTVRYEDLTTDPEATIRVMCDYLGVRYQARMLRYRRSHNAAGLGDWSPNIRSGRIQPHPPLPARDTVPEMLLPLMHAWGY